MKVTSLTVVGLLLSCGMMSASEEMPTCHAKSLIPVIKKLEEHKEKLLSVKEYNASAEDVEIAGNLRILIDSFKERCSGEAQDSETDVERIKRLEVGYHCLKITQIPEIPDSLQPAIVAFKAFLDNLPDVDYQTPHNELQAEVTYQLSIHSSRTK